ncbi:MAG: helix-turn-helix transcriptional regulator [Bacteroidota bacterium]
MPEDLKHIKFRNSRNPDAAFEIVPLETLFTRTDLNHSPFKPHLVEFYLIIMVLEGHGKHFIDFQEYEYRVGSILTIRKDQIHQFVKSEVKGYMLLFTDDFLVSYLDKLESLKALHLFNELLGIQKLQFEPSAFSVITELVERIKKEYFQINDTYSQGVIRSELHILLTQLYRHKASLNPQVYPKKYLQEFLQLQELIEKHCQHTQKVNDYAEMMSLTSRTLNNICHSIVKKSAKKLIDEIAITQIKRLLINTELSVKEVAYSSGFEETTNFFKYFKRHTLNTPEQFRKVHI